MPGIKPDGSPPPVNPPAGGASAASQPKNSEANPADTSKYLPEAQSGPDSMDTQVSDRQVKFAPGSIPNLIQRQHDFSNQLIPFDQAYSGLMLVHQCIDQANGLFYQPLVGPAVMVSPGGSNLPTAIQPQYQQLVNTFLQQQLQMMTALNQQLLQCQQQLQIMMGQFAIIGVQAQLPPQQFLQLLPPPVMQPQAIAMDTFPGLYPPPVTPMVQGSPWYPQGWQLPPAQAMISGFPAPQNHWLPAQYPTPVSPDISGFYFLPQPPVPGMAFQHPLSPQPLWSDWVNDGLHLPQQAFYDYMMQPPPVYPGLPPAVQPQPAPSAKPADYHPYLAPLQQQQQQLEARLAELKNQRQTGSSDPLKTWQDELNQLRKELLSETADKHQLQGRLDALEQTLEQHIQNNKRLGEEKHALTAELDALAERLAAAKNREQYSDGALKQLRVEFNNLQIKASEEASSKALLEDRFEMLNQQLQWLEQNNSMLKTENEALLTQLNEQAKRVGNAIASGRLSAEREDLDRMLHQETNRRTAAERTFSEPRDVIETQQADIIKGQHAETLTQAQQNLLTAYQASDEASTPAEAISELEQAIVAIKKSYPTEENSLHRSLTALVEQAEHRKTLLQRKQKITTFNQQVLDYPDNKDALQQVDTDIQLLLKQELQPEKSALLRIQAHAKAQIRKLNEKDQLLEHVRTLQTEVESLKNQQRLLGAAEVSRDERISLLQQDLQAAQTKTKLATAEKQTLQQAIEAVKWPSITPDELAKVASTINNLPGSKSNLTLTKLSQRISELASYIHGIDQEKITLQRQKDELDESLSSLNKRLDEQSSISREIISEQKEQIEEMQKTIKTLTDDNRDKKNNIVQLNQTIRYLNGTIKIHEDSFGELTQQHRSVEYELEHFKTDHKHCKTDITQLKSKIEELEEQYSTLKESLLREKESSEQAKSQLKDTKGELEIQKQKVTKAKASEISTDQRNIDLHREISCLENQLRSKTSALESLSSQAKELQIKLNTSNTALEAEQKKTTTLKDDLLQIEKDKQEAITQKEHQEKKTEFELKSQISQLTEQIEDAVDTNKRHIELIASLQQENNCLTKDIHERNNTDQELTNLLFNMEKKLKEKELKENEIKTLSHDRSLKIEALQMQLETTTESLRDKEEDHKQEIIKLEAEKQQLIDENKKTDSALTTLLDRVKHLQSKYDSQQSNSDMYTSSEVDAYIDNISTTHKNKLQNLLEDLKKSKEELQQLDEVRKELETLEKTIKEYQDDAIKKDSAISDLKAELSEQGRELEDARHKLAVTPPSLVSFTDQLLPAIDASISYSEENAVAEIEEWGVGDNESNESDLVFVNADEDIIEDTQTNSVIERKTRNETDLPSNDLTVVAERKDFGSHSTDNVSTKQITAADKLILILKEDNDYNLVDIAKSIMTVIVSNQSAPEAILTFITDHLKQADASFFEQFIKKISLDNQIGTIDDNNKKECLETLKDILNQRYNNDDLIEMTIVMLHLWNTRQFPEDEDDAMRALIHNMITQASEDDYASIASTVFPTIQRMN